MQIGRPTPDPERPRGHEVDFTRGNREAIARSMEEARQAEASERARREAEAAKELRKEILDQVEIGVAGRQEVEEREHEDRVEVLKALHERGRLNTPERIERAASRILSDP